VLNILLRMSVISLQFSFKNLSFRNLSFRGSRTREEILGSSKRTALGTAQCQTQGARGHERRPTSGDRRACGGLGV
jgi:hypothetical protein